jgi:hypothetical protein
MRRGRSGDLAVAAAGVTHDVVLDAAGHVTEGNQEKW